MGLFGKFLGKRKVDIKKRFSLHKEGISGTMSKFYQATDRENNREVGLKIINVEKMRQVEDRYVKFGKAGKKPSEGEIAMSLSHPYIVETYEYGFTTNNEPYLVMEYLEGTGLNNVLMLPRDLLAGARLPYIRQCAEALRYVHEHDYIHRDYCPRNLLFTGDGRSLKLIDFGLTVPNRPPFTDPGGRTGTPNYMAPELVRRKPTSTMVDIFAFGVTMYELCSRQLPWPSGASLAAMNHDQPPIQITTLVPNLNPKLAQAIHQCILPDPRNRPTIQDFLKMISRLETDTVES